MRSFGRRSSGADFFGPSGNDFGVVRRHFVSVGFDLIGLVWFGSVLLNNLRAVGLESSGVEKFGRWSCSVANGDGGGGRPWTDDDASGGPPQHALLCGHSIIIRW